MCVLLASLVKRTGTLPPTPVLQANMTNSLLENMKTKPIQYTQRGCGAGEGERALEGRPLLDLLTTFYSPAEKDQWSPIFTWFTGMPECS